MFLDFSRDQLQIIQAPFQESNPKHKQKFFAKNCKSSALILAKQKAVTKFQKK